MAIAKRIFLFMVVNILVMASLMLVVSLIGMFLPPELYAQIMGSIVPFAAIFGFGGAFVSLLLSKFMAKMFMGVKIIDPKTATPELKWVLDTTHRMARSAGIITMPEVGYYESPELNAFATGPTKNKALVAVSTGLLRSMNRDEVEGVLGHEVAHVANGDMVTMTLVQGVVNTLVIIVSHFVTQIIDNITRDQEGRGGLSGFMGFFVYNLVYNLIAFAAFPIVAWVSRIREYRADAGGAKLAGREKMIAGLQALKRQMGMVDDSHQSLSTLKISNKSGFSIIWSTHPPLDDRIKKLSGGRF
jgi:heat shock protein HtpX